MKAARSVQADSEVIPASAAENIFQELFLKHWAWVYRLLERMLGDPAEAEDQALEVFYRLHQQPLEDLDSGYLRGWLYRVAIHLGLHSIRSRERRQQYELAAGRNALDEASPDRPPEILERKENHELARRVLSLMPSRQAELLSLRYSGLAYKEIAEELDLAPTSIGPLLLRAEREFARIYRSLSREEL